MGKRAVSTQRGRGGEACTRAKVSVVRNCWRPWRLAKELRRLPRWAVLKNLPAVQETRVRVAG